LFVFVYSDNTDKQPRILLQHQLIVPRRWWVGTLLVLINQWEAVVGAGSMDWVKVALTYCVPYMVSTYTSVSKDLHLRREAETAEQRVHEEAQKIRFQKGAL